MQGAIVAAVSLHCQGAGGTGCQRGGEQVDTGGLQHYNTPNSRLCNKGLGLDVVTNLKTRVSGISAYVSF